MISIFGTVISKAAMEYGYNVMPCISATGKTVLAISMTKEEFQSGDDCKIIQINNDFFIAALNRFIPSALEIPANARAPILETSRAQAVAAYIGFRTNSIIHFYETGKVVALLSNNQLRVLCGGKIHNMDLLPFMSLSYLDFEVGDTVVLYRWNSVWHVCGWVDSTEIPYEGNITGSFYMRTIPYNAFAPALLLQDSDGNSISGPVNVKCTFGTYNVKGEFIPLSKEVEYIAELETSYVTDPAAFYENYFYDSELDSFSRVYLNNFVRFDYTHADKSYRYERSTEFPSLNLPVGLESYYELSVSGTQAILTLDEVLQGVIGEKVKVAEVFAIVNTAGFEPFFPSGTTYYLDVTLTSFKYNPADRTWSTIFSCETTYTIGIPPVELQVLGHVQAAGTIKKMKPIKPGPDKVATFRSSSLAGQAIVKITNPETGDVEETIRSITNHNCIISFGLLDGDYTVTPTVISGGGP